MSAPIFNVNYNSQNQQIIPPDLRQPKEVSWLYSISYPLQRLHDLIWNNGYADGSIYPNWATSSTYVPANGGTLVGSRVIYINRGVYECTATASGSLQTPLDITHWELINTNYIGASERVQYNSQRILYEYALNRWFQTNAYGNWSTNNPFFGWIYIKNNSVGINSFVLGQTGQYSSDMYTNSSSANMLNHPGSGGSNTYCYTINVPISVANKMDPGNTYSVPTASPNTINIVKSFADTINQVGFIYNVVTY